MLVLQPIFEADLQGARLDARWQWNRWLEQRFGLLELKWNPRRLPRAKA